MVIFFGKENSKDKMYRVKFGGLQEIRDGLIRFVMKHFTISPVASVVHNYNYILPCVHAQGVKKSICLSVIIVVVSTKIARSRVLGICACCKHIQSVDISEKPRFKLLKMAY